MSEYQGIERRRVALEGVVDRRQHARFAVDAWAEVMLKDGSMLFRGRVLDLSVEGCYVETEARLRLMRGTPVEMVFRVRNRVFRCEAASRTRRARGAGFLFEISDTWTREQLERLTAELGQDGD